MQLFINYNVEVLRTSRVSVPGIQVAESAKSVKRH